MLNILAGAGVSLDPPACLPTALEINRAIFNKLVPPEFYPKLKPGSWRFESLMEVLQSTFDPSLSLLRKLFDVLGSHPNSCHSFLADALQAGHRVFTTNFDILIEKAYEEKYKETLQTAATEEEFKTYASSSAPVLFKLHGCIKKPASIQATLSSLRQVSAVREDPSEPMVPLLSPQKQDVLKKYLDGCPLLVLGYSGGDDIDIMPTLESLWEKISGLGHPLQSAPLPARSAHTSGTSVFWVQHSRKKRQFWNGVSPDNRESSFSSLDRWITIGLLQEQACWGGLTKTAGFLRTITPILFPDKREGNQNSRRLGFSLAAKWQKVIDRIGQREYKHFLSESLDTWLADLNTCKSARMHFVGELLLQVGEYTTARNVLSQALTGAVAPARQKIHLSLLTTAGDKEGLESQIQATVENEEYEAAAYGYWLLGSFFRKDGARFESSLALCEQGLRFASSAGPAAQWVEARLLNLKGNLYKVGKNYDQAMDLLKQALQLNQSLKDDLASAVNLANLGAVYLEKGTLGPDTGLIKDAAMHFEQAMKFFSTYGHWSAWATSASNYGRCLAMLGEYHKARLYWERAQKIFTRKNDLHNLRISQTWSDEACNASHW